MASEPHMFSTAPPPSGDLGMPSSGETTSSSLLGSNLTNSQFVGAIPTNTPPFIGSVPLTPIRHATTSAPLQHINTNSLAGFQIASITPLNVPISIKLNQDNFLTWQAQMLPLINGYNLASFLNSPPPNPTIQSVSGQLQMNPDYLPWSRQDQLLLGWLRSSLTENIQAQLVSCTTAADLWHQLQKSFSTSSRARLIDLKRQLQSTMKGASSCTDYLQKIRRIAR